MKMPKPSEKLKPDPRMEKAFKAMCAMAENPEAMAKAVAEGKKKEVAEGKRMMKGS